MPILQDPLQALSEAMDSPVGCQRLSDLAKTAKSVCILICDITRPVPNGLILPRLIEVLLASGIRAENITVLVATGLHRHLFGQDMARETLHDSTAYRVKFVRQPETTPLAQEEVSDA